MAQPPESGLWLIRARDGNPVRRVAGARALDPDWSPDGRRIVFRTVYGQREDGRTIGGPLRRSRDGKRRRQLVHREDIAETTPSWSPNGRWIAWISLRFLGGDEPSAVIPSIWRVRAHGGRLRKTRQLPEPNLEPGPLPSMPHLTGRRADYVSSWIGQLTPVPPRPQ